MIPAQIRLVLLAGAFLLVVAVSAGAGLQIGTWRANSAHAGEVRAHASTVAALNGEIQHLRGAIAKQNEAVALLAAESERAKDAQRKAEEFAAELARVSASRVARLEQAVKNATTADEVLREYWELSK